MQFITNIFRVVFSNLILILSNVVLGLVLPLFLSVKGYGEYRLFLFYAGYIGLLHFGFIDAMYLKYGGINKDLVNKQLLKKEHNVFFLYQITITAIIFLVAALLKNCLFTLLALAILPLNGGAFHKLFYQATGQFRKYSNINIMSTFVNLLLISLLLLFREKSAVIYILFTVITYIIVYLIMEVDFYKYTKGIIPKGKPSLLKYNKVGIFILIGNICVLLISSVGSWIVQIFLGIKDFAYYSFAVSMMNMVLLIINAVGLTFYNYIAKNEDRDTLILVKDILLVIGAFAGCIYFILNVIVKFLIPKYVLALSIIAISFTAFPYLMVINVIITNIYKARKQEKKYLEVVLTIFVVGIILNGLAFLLFRSMDSIAFATLLSYIVWYIYSIFIDFNYLKGTKREVFFLGVQGITFLISANYFTWYGGLLFYFCITFILSIVLYRKNIAWLLYKIKNTKN